MFHELPQPYRLPREPKILLHRLPWPDQPFGPVGAEQVPRVEAGEVLEGAKKFVAANWKAIEEVSAKR